MENTLMLTLIAAVGLLWSARQLARVLGAGNGGVVERVLSILFRAAYWVTTLVGINFVYVFVCTVRKTIC